MAFNTDDYEGLVQNPSDQPHTIEHPAQSNPWAGDNFNVTNKNQRGGSVLDVGDLQRKYDFGNTYTNLSYDRDPFSTC